MNFWVLNWLFLFEKYSNNYRILFLYKKEAENSWQYTWHVRRRCQRACSPRGLLKYIVRSFQVLDVWRLAFKQNLLIRKDVRFEWSRAYSSVNVCRCSETVIIASFHRHFYPNVAFVKKNRRAAGTRDTCSDIIRQLKMPRCRL